MLFCFREKVHFFENTQIWFKKLKIVVLGTYFESADAIANITLYVLERKCAFWAVLIPKIKVVNLILSLESKTSFNMVNSFVVLTFLS